MNGLYLILIFILAASGLLIGESASNAGPCEGVYRSGNNQVVALSKFDPGGGNLLLFFIDFGSGYARVLQEKNGELSAGPSLISESPVQLRVTCNSSGVQWNIHDQKFSADRISITQETVEFKSGSAKLAGTLFMPPGHGPFPALILFHGSGKLTRYSFGPIPYFFCAKGFAVLAYDKRGTGESEGDFQKASFPEFIADGNAAVSYLQAREGIDADQIGLWGSSQGGFIAAGVAAESHTVKFVIDQSGMFVPAWKQEIYRVSSEMQARGYSEADIHTANSYLNSFFETGRAGSPEDWQKTMKLAAALRDKEWFDLLPHADDLRETVSFWKDDYSYDPATKLEHVKCPVRAVFGALDKSTPVDETIQRMTQALKGRDFQYAIIRKANHALLEAKNGSEKEIPELQRFVPEAFEIQARWALELTQRASEH